MTKINKVTEALEQLKNTGKSVQLLIDSIKNNFNVEIIRDLLALPYFKHRIIEKINILLSVLEDENINDYVIDAICDALVKEPSGSLLAEFYERLDGIIHTKAYLFSNEQLIKIAETFEVLYACGFKDFEKLIIGIYRKVKLASNSFVPTNYNDIRIRFARYAYNCNDYNYYETISKMDELISKLKRSGVKGYKGMWHYYYGLCERYSKYKLLENDTMSHMQISRNCAFELAEKYLKHH